MTEPHDVIDLLRRAMPEDPPDELVSPHAPAAQALFEEILSMQTIHSPEPSADVAAETPPRGDPRPRRRPAGRIAAAAAVAVVAGAAAAFVVVPPSEPSAAAVVERALTTTGRERSGRADVTWEIPEIDPNDTTVVPAPNGEETWEFSGDDVEVIMHDLLAPQGFPGDVINMQVDGERYGYRPNQLTGGPFEWTDDGPVAPGDEMFGINPATLLDELRPEGGFEDLGDEQVDGVTTRHFRATRPGDVPTDAIRDWVRNRGDVTGLDIWVDEDDLVRRLDIGFAGGDPDEAPGETPVSPSTASIRFYDFGEVTLEPPPVDAEP